MNKVQGLISRTIRLISQFQDIFKDRKDFKGNLRTSRTSGQPVMISKSIEMEHCLEMDK